VLAPEMCADSRKDKGISVNRFEACERLRSNRRESGSYLSVMSGLAVILPERTKIKSGSYNFGSTNNVESAFPARV
jgi:hypothetical protein